MAARSSEPNAGSENILQLVNCCKSNEQCLRLIKELTGGEVSPNEESEEETSRVVEWRVDNKYYTASIRIHLSLAPDQQIKSPFEALVIVCELEESDHLERIKDIWSKKDSSTSQPGVALLVGIIHDGCNDSVQRTVHWCTDNGIELVNWRPDNTDKKSKDKEEDSDDDDDDDDDGEGISRISEALQAHMWPEMTLKGKEKASSNDNKNETEPAVPDDLIIPDFLSSKSVEPDPGGESFEDLFERFASMRAHAETLPYEERKVYAEKVVMSFWRAIGGDDDEIDLNND